MIDFFQRLDKYMEYKGLNDNKVTVEAGISNGLIGKARKRGALSQDNISKILHTYSDLDANWLFTGNGSMIKSDQNVIAEPVMSYRKTKDPIYELQRVPVYNLDATMGLVPMVDSNGIDEEKIIDYISLGMLPKCDGAISATGDSMYPLLKAGDLVAYKSVPVDRGNIFFGEMYLLSIYIDESTTMKTIKFVHPSDLGEDYIKIVSHNQHHAPKDVHLNQIAAMGLVRASIRIHN